MIPLENFYFFFFPPFHKGWGASYNLQSNSSESPCGFKIHSTRKSFLWVAGWQTLQLQPSESPSPCFCVFCWKREELFPFAEGEASVRKSSLASQICFQQFLLLTISNCVSGIMFTEHSFKQHEQCTSWKLLEGGEWLAIKETIKMKVLSTDN